MNQKKDHFSRFFIAILPPETIQREITDFKEEIARDFKSSHALKSPPHITLLMPFRVITTCRYNRKFDLGNYRDLPFHPHVTIGFRDLKKEEFFKAKEVFRKRQYEARFTCERMSLLKHDGEQWEPFYP